MEFAPNLKNLHTQEEALRKKSIEVVLSDPEMCLNISMIEEAMDVSVNLQQILGTTEDFQVIDMLSKRFFNALGASQKLALSGYYQNSALILRDVLESVFLIDLFRRRTESIAEWRNANRKIMKKEFSPMAVRIKLDKMDGTESSRREQIYRDFCELAGHPTMKSSSMLSPIKGGSSVNGPFVEKTSLSAVLNETGRLALQVGGHLLDFYPSESDVKNKQREKFYKVGSLWVKNFYPDALKV